MSSLNPSISTDFLLNPDSLFFLERGQENLRSRDANINYQERQSLPNQESESRIAAFGPAAKPYIGNLTLQDQINNTKIRGQFDDKDGRLQINPNLKNEFLDIPSFLIYPQELGLNSRYKHFMVFNIYQGTSDEIRLATREGNLAESAVLAKGGWQFNAYGENERSTILRQALASAGYTGTQLDQALQRLTATARGATGAIDGFTSDARIGAIDKAITGVYNAIENKKINPEQPDGAIAEVLNALKTEASKVAEFGEDAIQGIGTFLYSYIQQSLQDGLDPANSVPRNLEQRGISGKRIYRDRKENSILLANRRFNNANVKSKDTICLYMPQKIAFNDQMVYSEEEMGGIKTLADAITGKRGAISALIEKGLARGLADQIGRLPGVNLAGDLNLAGVRAAATRSVPNPRREMMFRDVGVRTHTFSFDFSPDNPQEADTVLHIIRMLRYHAYPGLQGGGGHFFTFPAEFDITFYTISNGQVFVNDNLPKMPRLGLQSISVDYSAAGDYKTFTDSKPAFIRIDLQFQEMEQLTNEHIIHGY